MRILDVHPRNQCTVFLEQRHRLGTVLEACRPYELDERTSHTTVDHVFFS